MTNKTRRHDPWGLEIVQPSKPRTRSLARLYVWGNRAAWVLAALCVPFFLCRPFCGPVRPAHRARAAPAGDRTGERAEIVEFEDRASVFRGDDPAAAVIVGQRQDEHDEPPNHTSESSEVEHAAAPFDVHEKEHDERGFGDRDSERDNQIEGAEVDVAETPGESEQEQEREAIGPVKFRRKGHVLCHLCPAM